MPWGAVIGGAVSLIGGAMSSSSSSSAARAQSQADQAATAEQQREFNIIQQLYGPQRNLGYSAMGSLASLYGFPNPQTANYPASQGLNGSPSYGGIGNYNPGDYNTGGRLSTAGPNLFGGGRNGVVGGGQQQPGAAPSNGAPNYSSFYSQPGYGFTLDQGLKAINRQASANGNLYSTNNLNQLGNYAEGVASQQYNNYVNQLMQMAGLGGAAVSGTGTAAMNSGNNISSLMVGQGNANASGIIAGSNSMTNAMKAAGGYLSNPNLNWGNVFGGGGGGFDPQSGGTGSSWLAGME